MPRLEYERINWENAPSTETPINAENLNIMDNAIAALFTYLSELEERIDNLSQQDATAMTATFGEPGEEGVDEAPLQTSGSSIGNIVTGIHSRIRALQNGGGVNIKFETDWGIVASVSGSRYAQLRVQFRSAWNNVLAVIPLAAHKYEELLGAADENESNTESDSSEPVGVLFQSTWVSSSSRYFDINFESVGPVAENYEIQYLVIYTE